VWAVVAVLGTLALVIALGTAWAFSRIGGATEASPDATASGPPSAAPTTTTPTTTQPPPPPPVPVQVLALDPQGDGEENDDELAFAIDGDPETMWRTVRYDTQAFGGLPKDGVGIVLDLGGPKETRGMVLTALGSGGTVEIRASQTPTIDGSTLLATGVTDDVAPLTFTWDAVQSPYVIVWFTALPTYQGEWRGVVSEVKFA
jgi:hypothetical protein